LREPLKDQELANEDRRKQAGMMRNSETRNRRAGGNRITIRSWRFGEREPRCAEQKEELTGPEQDVQKAAAFEIVEILGMETDIERLAGALFDESSHGNEIDGLRAKGAAPGVQALEFLIAGEQEVLQAEILLIQ